MYLPTTSIDISLHLIRLRPKSGCSPYLFHHEFANVYFGTYSSKQLFTSYLVKLQLDLSLIINSKNY